ncbi:MAG: class I SAM-dependent methyltransferase [Actinobacteria bacterium]|jgi:SAM-dependent methyltransferase|nr:class I SAM-dependent methyltransferase [Actinomycetota bacterium]
MEDGHHGHGHGHDHEHGDGQAPDLHDPRSFDERASTWDDDPKKVERARLIAAAIREALPVTGEMRLLEYGAGTGLLAQFLAPHVGSLTLADPSEGMRAVMRDKAERGDLPGAEVVDIDLADTAHFDLVVSLMALHHVPEPDAALVRLGAATESGGWIALVDLEAEDGSFHGEGFGGHHGFDQEQLRGWLYAAGYGPVSFSRVHTMSKGGREYPLFLAVSRRQGVAD